MPLLCKPLSGSHTYEPNRLIFFRYQRSFMHPGTRGRESICASWRLSLLLHRPLNIFSPQSSLLSSHRRKMRPQSVSATLVPPLMTSGAPNPLTAEHMSGGATSEISEAQRVRGLGLTNSYADHGGTICVAEGAYVDCSAVVHTCMAAFSIGAYSVVCAGAVLRPPMRVCVNQASARTELCIRIGSFVYVGEQVVCEAAEIGHMARLDAQCVVSTGAHLPDGVWLMARTWVPPEVTLSPYTVYTGVPATPIRKLNARSYQLLHMEFMRRQREAT